MVGKGQGHLRHHRPGHSRPRRRLRAGAGPPGPTSSRSRPSRAVRGSRLRLPRSIPPATTSASTRFA